jgi:hypothetical protein
MEDHGGPQESQRFRGQTGPGHGATRPDGCVGGGSLGGRSGGGKVRSRGASLTSRRKSHI